MGLEVGMMRWILRWMIGAVWSVTQAAMTVEMLEGAGTEAGVETLGGMRADFTVTISIVLAGEAYGDSRRCKQGDCQGRLCLTLCRADPMSDHHRAAVHLEAPCFKDLGSTKRTHSICNGAMITRC